MHPASLGEKTTDDHHITHYYYEVVNYIFIMDVVITANNYNPLCLAMTTLEYLVVCFILDDKPSRFHTIIGRIPTRISSPFLFLLSVHIDLFWVVI